MPSSRRSSQPRDWSHCRWIFHHLSHQGSLWFTFPVFPFPSILADDLASYFTREGVEREPAQVLFSSFTNLLRLYSYCKHCPLSFLLLPNTVYFLLKDTTFTSLPTLLHHQFFSHKCFTAVKHDIVSPIKNRKKKISLSPPPSSNQTTHLLSFVTTLTKGHLWSLSPFPLLQVTQPHSKLPFHLCEFLSKSLMTSTLPSPIVNS